MTQSRPLNPHIKLVRLALSEAFDTLLNDLKQYRMDKGKRGRGKLEPEVLRVITLITLDLFVAWETSSDLLVGYSRNAKEFPKGGRYWDDKAGQKLFTETVFLSVIDGLSALGYIDDEPAKQGSIGKSSRMKAKQKLIDVMKEHGINWSAIDASPDPSNVIELKSEKDKQENQTKLPFEDSVDVKIPTIRDALVGINEALKKTLINLKATDDQFAVINNRLSNDKDRQMVNFSNRYIVRKFTNGSFGDGGRFYGGWWMDIPKEYRKFIQIQGKPTAELDYSTLHPTILYLKKSLKPPKDSYDLHGWDKEHRSIYKKTFNQLLNSKQVMHKKSMWGSFAPEILKSDNAPGCEHLSQSDRIRINREKFIRLTGRDYNDLIEATLEKHQRIQNRFFTQAWTWLQRLDSDIAEMVMLKMLNEEDIPVLQLHDSFIVRTIFKDILSDVMEKSFKEVIKGEPTIDAKASLLDGVSKFYSLSDFTFDDYLEDQSTHSGYHQRTTEWITLWNSTG